MLPRRHLIYSVVNGKEPIQEEFSSLIVQIAPYLSLSQIQYILKKLPYNDNNNCISRLKYISSLKERIQLISEGAGDSRFLLQPLVIAFFLGEVVRPLPD